MDNTMMIFCFCAMRDACWSVVGVVFIFGFGGVQGNVCLSFFARLFGKLN